MPKEEATEQPQEQGQAAERGRSTVQFPYLDLNDAVAIAKGVHETGGTSCQLEQLAAHLQQPTDGSMFRVRLGTARIFGLTNASQGSVTLTPLGIRICDPTQEPAAKAEAFLTVPLYRQIYEQFKGVNLPPASALETTIANMGVAPKQKSTARQVFHRSATQAGFFAYGPSRLVLPPTKAGTVLGVASEGSSSIGAVRTAEPTPQRNGAGGGEGGGGEDQHPFITGLIKTLPPSGGQWPLDKRAQWLQAAVSVFNLIYMDDGPGGRIEVKVQKEQLQ
jgi:hypothetical protein